MVIGIVNSNISLHMFNYFFPTSFKFISENIMYPELDHLNRLI